MEDKLKQYLITEVCKHEGGEDETCPQCDRWFEEIKKIISK